MVGKGHKQSNFCDLLFGWLLLYILIIVENCCCWCCCFSLVSFRKCFNAIYEFFLACFFFDFQFKDKGIGDVGGIDIGWRVVVVVVVVVVEVPLTKQEVGKADLETSCTILTEPNILKEDSDMIKKGFKIK